MTSEALHPQSQSSKLRRFSSSHLPIDTRLLDKIPAAAILTDLQGCILYWNDGAVELFGWTTDEMIGRSCSDRFHPDVRDRVNAAIVKIREGKDWQGEFQDYRKDGSPVWIDSRVSCVTDDNGQAVAMLGIAYDITDRKNVEFQLRASECRLAEAQKIARLASWVWDPVTQSVWWSDGLYDLFGVDRAQVTPSFEAFLDLLHPDDRPIAEARAKEVHAGSDLVSNDLRLIRPDGRMIWIHSRSLATRDKDGRLIRVEGTDQDITERKLAEQALRESEERNRSISDTLRISEERLRLATLATNDAIWDLDLTTGDVTWNDSYARLLGRFAKNDASTQWWQERIHPDDRPAIMDSIQRTLEGNSNNWGAEYRFLLPDGSWAEIEDRAYISRDDAGKARRIVGAMRDVTDRNGAQRAYRESEERFRSVLNHSPTLVYLKDLDGRYLFVNKRCAEAMGTTPEQCIGKTCRNFFATAIAEQMEDLDRKVVREKCSLQLEESITLASGRQARFLFVHFALRKPDGEIYGVCGIGTDVTDQKRLEEQFRQAQKMEAIGQLAGGVAHDFNNLLTVIRGYSELLCNQHISANTEVQEQLQAICEAGDRAADLTSQLLAFSRKAIVDPRVIDLNGAVADSARLLRRLIGEDIRLVTDLAPDLWSVKMDPVQLEQTLMNLSVNARDAMPRGGQLTIRTCNVYELPIQFCEPRSEDSDPRQAKFVLLTVIDDGVGMSEDVKAHIFEPFFTTKGVGRGTGMGLATVYGIVHQAGGFIEVDSQADMGTVFRIYLPAVAEPLAVASSSASAQILGGSETILIVEDEDAVRTLAKLILEMHGYTVLAARCGADALTVITNHNGSIDLLLSDVVMPDMSGSDLADEVRRLRPGVHVLYMSGYTDDAVVRRGVASADDAFLQKPFTPASLTQKVREVISNPISR